MEHDRDSIRILADLVAFDTTSRVSNLPLIDHVEERLAAVGAVCRRTSDATGTKANLLARLGPPAEGGVVLSAHSDVVPVDGQPWSSDPFTLRRDGERLYGRGTTDMKGFVAAWLAAAPEAVRRGLRRPITLALSYDEEVGTIGAPDLVADLLGHEPRPTTVVVGEPTSMDIVVAHKGVRSFRTVVTGRDAHSSQPARGANAVVAAARIATFVDDLATRQATVATDERFDPPHTTFNVAEVHGGTAINIIPRRCELVWEYRPIPADDGDVLAEEVARFVAADVLPRLRATHPEATIATEPIGVVPTLDGDPVGPAVRLVADLLDGAATRAVAYGTDGGHFQDAGIPTVVCGPGSIDQAHQPDEYLEVDQLVACERFLARLVDRSTRA